MTQLLAELLEGEGVGKVWGRHSTLLFLCGKKKRNKHTRLVILSAGEAEGPWKGLNTP